MGLEGAALAGLGKAFLIPPPRPPSTHAAPGGAGARSSPPRGTPSTTDEGSNPVKVAGPRLAQFLQLVSKSRCLAGAPEPSLPLGRARDKVGFVPSDQSGGARPCHLPRRPVDGQRPRAPRPPPPPPAPPPSQPSGNPEAGGSGTCLPRPAAATAAGLKGGRRPPRPRAPAPPRPPRPEAERGRRERPGGRRQTHEQPLVAPAAATWGSENEMDFSEK
ncbi:hypothetical protein VULLAG_LOCUS4391 [Vulpes lagopus]